MKIIIMRNACIIRQACLRTSRLFYSSLINYKEDQIKIDKYKINYLKVGNGAHSVLCMPGAMGSIWTDFKPQVEGFDKEKFQLIVWDAPGYGKSRPPEREFHTDYFGQDVEVAIKFMKALNIPKFSLLGWSYGGATSMILAARHPEVVQKMVLWGTSSFLFPHEMELYKHIKDVRKWSEKMRKPMIDLYSEEKFPKLWANVVDSMEAAYNAKDGRFCHLLKNVSCPTFNLHGEKDSVSDKSHALYLHKHIRGSRIYYYPEGRHDIHIQNADDFNQKVQEFLLQS